MLKKIENLKLINKRAFERLNELKSISKDIDTFIENVKKDDMISFHEMISESEVCIMSEEERLYLNSLASDILDTGRLCRTFLVGDDEGNICLSTAIFYKHYLDKDMKMKNFVYIQDNDKISFVD